VTPGWVDIHTHYDGQVTWDLSGNGNRLVQEIDGYRYTVKSGEVTYEEGRPTGAMPGKLVRGPQLAPNA
jgi:N-acyl-D-aspartate/D-glutamate deacylase